jgi:hypothetical protein
MMRLFNLAVIASLVGTASWAYSIKYETIYFVETLKGLDKELERERETLAILKAEWQHLNQPSRLQVLTDRHLALKPLKATQIVGPTELPARDVGVDLLGEKLDDLLATSSVPTPDRGRRSSGRTPGE